MRKSLEDTVREMPNNLAKPLTKQAIASCNYKGKT